MLTIHNLAYQGLFSPKRMAALGVPEAAFSQYGVEFHGRLSYLKAGIFYASHVTTVSGTYAREITRRESGCGLDGLLATRAHEGRLTGILNGIEDGWGGAPGAGSSETAAWKAANAEAVRKAFGLAVGRGPLFAIISRLVHQKGVDLAIEALGRDRSPPAARSSLSAPAKSASRKPCLGCDAAAPTRSAPISASTTIEARAAFAGSDFC